MRFAISHLFDPAGRAASADACHVIDRRLREHGVPCVLIQLVRVDSYHSSSATDSLYFYKLPQEIASDDFDDVTKKVQRHVGSIKFRGVYKLPLFGYLLFGRDYRAIRNVICICYDGSSKVGQSLLRILALIQFYATDQSRPGLSRELAHFAVRGSLQMSAPLEVVLMIVLAIFLS